MNEPKQPKNEPERPEIEDRPLRQVSELAVADAYGLGPHAFAFAQLIQHLLTQDAFDGQVIGVNAPWGGGKTSLTNVAGQLLRGLDASEHGVKERVSIAASLGLLRHDALEWNADSCAQHEEDIDAAWKKIGELRTENLCFADVDVWQSGGDADLADLFFSAIWSAMEESGGSNGDKAQRMLQDLESLVAKDASVVGSVVKLATRGLNIFRTRKHNDSFFGSPRRLLFRALERHAGETRIILLIDDLDRLTPVRIEQVISAIWWIRELPGVLVVVLYDQARVTQAIASVLFSDTHQEHAERVREAARYLEKVVNFNFELPAARPAELVDRTLRQLGFGELRAQARFGRKLREKVGEAILKNYVTTPRSVKRLVTAVKSFEIMYGLKGMDPLDFLVLQALRLFDANLYLDVMMRALTADWDAPAQGTDMESDADWCTAFLLPSLFKPERGSQERFETAESVENRGGFGSRATLDRYLTGSPLGSDDLVNMVVRGFRQEEPTRPSLAWIQLVRDALKYVNKKHLLAEYEKSNRADMDAKQLEMQGELFSQALTHASGPLDPEH